MGFRHLVTLVQIGKLNELNNYDKLRAKKVESWLNKHAGDDMKFEVQNKVVGKFSKKEKDALCELGKVLSSGDFSEKELFDKFYEICEKVGLKNTEFFDVCYRVIIGKSKGPRLAALIKAVGQNEVVKLLGTLK